MRQLRGWKLMENQNDNNLYFKFKFSTIFNVHLQPQHSASKKRVARQRGSNIFWQISVIFR